MRMSNCINHLIGIAVVLFDVSQQQINQKGE
jgi:hypothetical protein